MSSRTLIQEILGSLLLVSTLCFATPKMVEARLSRGADHAGSLSAYTPNDCDHVIALTTSTADGRTNFSSVRPGDTVCIAAGNRGGLNLRNFTGTVEKPITFINDGGKVVIKSTGSNGILVQNSRFFRLAGSGEPGITYGIKIVQSSNLGVGIGFKSSDFEVDHLEITNVETGISSKTEPVCSDGSTSDWRAYDYDGDGVEGGDINDVVNRNNFTQYNTVLHNNYVHHVRMGFYIGSSFYRAGNDLSCASGPETVFPPVLRGVKVYNNLLEHMSWKGVQVGSAVEGCGIHHNTIYRDGEANDQDHQVAIMNNQGSVCNIFNNFIKESGGPGIFVQGNGGNRIYNNIIVGPGQSRYRTGYGIGIFTGSNKGNSVYTWHNVIVDPYVHGVEFHNDKGTDNRIQNNIIVDSDGKFIETAGQSNVVVSHNLNVYHVSGVKFTDPASDDYSIRLGSPAVDAGIDLSYAGIVRDYRGATRPQGAGYDIGAYEFLSQTVDTPTPMPTDTPPPTYTPTPLPTSTPTPTPSPSYTPTSPPTDMPTVMPTNTPSPTYTPSSLPTITPGPNNTSTVTSTPSRLPTDTPSPKGYYDIFIPVVVK